jgi:hypothetical protein
MFGHLITLNFNQRGDKHKTLIGAFFSIWIKLFIYVYIILTFQTMFTKKANRNSTIASIESIESLGEEDYDKMGLLIYFIPMY